MLNDEVPIKNFCFHGQMSFHYSKWAFHSSQWLNQWKNCHFWVLFCLLLKTSITFLNDGQSMVYWTWKRVKNDMEKDSESLQAGTYWNPWWNILFQLELGAWPNILIWMLQIGSIRPPPNSLNLAPCHFSLLLKCIEPLWSLHLEYREKLVK